MSNATTKRSPIKSSWASGGTIFAATIMLLIGIFQILMGISAIVNDSFLVLRGDYVYSVDVTGWGWIHLGLGALIVITGIGLFTGATWAKIAGIVLVGLSAIDNFLFLPYYPVWSLLLIGLDVFVIWALAFSLRSVGSPTDVDMMEETGAGYDMGQGGQRWAATNAAAGYRASDPEAARRASDMADNPARHAQSDMSGTQQEAHSAMAGGSMGTPMGTPPGSPPGGAPQPGSTPPPAPPTNRP